MDRVIEEMATRVQLWWMTQKHEPMHRNDARDLATAAYSVVQRRVEELEAALRSIMDEMDHGSGSAPGHSHMRPGIWDDDAGNTAVGRANAPCEWCRTWAVARAALNPRQNDGDRE